MAYHGNIGLLTSGYELFNLTGIIDRITEDHGTVIIFQFRQPENIELNTLDIFDLVYSRIIQKKEHVNIMSLERLS